MVLATEIILPPRRNSLNGPEPASKSPPKSHWWFLTSKLKPSTTYGSIHTVATQKLRESKWFDQDEERLFCAVIELGFIVEIMLKDQTVKDSKSYYGVVSVETKKSEYFYRTRSLDCSPMRCEHVPDLFCISPKQTEILSRGEQSDSNWR